MKQVVIIGGGITGLTAAWTLQQAGIDYALLEARPRFGGAMVTEQMTLPDGSSLRIEGGPDSVVASDGAIWKLATELGIREQVISVRDDPAGISIDHTQGIAIYADGSLMPVPTSPVSFIRSGLLSVRGKLRLLAEPFIAAKTDDGDESVLDFMARRLGREAAERLVGPILGGIYNTDPARQSIMVTSPMLRLMERKYGSLAMAMLRRGSASATDAEDAPPARVITFRQGMTGLVEAIVSQLTGDVRDSTPVKSIIQDESGYQVITATETIETAAVLLTMQANIAARLIGDVAPEAARHMRAIDHVNIGTATLVYRADDLADVPHFSGLLVPRREQSAVDAAKWASRKQGHAGSTVYEWLRVFFGSAQPQLVPEADTVILAEIRGALSRILPGFDADPVVYRLFRWQESYPQADVGHLVRVAAIEGALPSGMFVAGSSYRGISVPNCVMQGREIAGTIIGVLQEREQDSTAEHAR